MMINVTFFRASYHFKDDDLTSKEQKYTNNDERKKKKYADLVSQWSLFYYKTLYLPLLM